MLLAKLAVVIFDAIFSGDFRADQFNGVPFRVFFVVAPDGLCYMLGQRQA